MNRQDVIGLLMLLMILMILLLTACTDTEYVDKTCRIKCLNNNMSMESVDISKDTKEYSDIRCHCIAYITIDKKVKE